MLLFSAFVYMRVHQQGAGLDAKRFTDVRKRWDYNRCCWNLLQGRPQTNLEHVQQQRETWREGGGHVSRVD